MNILQQGYAQVANKLDETYQNIKDTIMPWSDVNNVLITQDDDCMECICPCICEGKNSYVVTSIDTQGNPQRRLATLDEESGFGARLCCQQFRPFKMKMNTDKDSDIEIFSEKPCGCTVTPLVCLNSGCYCVCINGVPCCRPLITVSSKSQVIGRVNNPFRVCGRSGCTCCPYDEIDIMDQNGNLKYMVSASCVQFGQCMRCIAGKEIVWQILDPMKVNRYLKFLKQNQQVVGNITNVYNGCYKEFCTKEDKFTISFPPNATYNEKILLIHAAIMIDFDIFEDTCCRLW